MPPPALPPRKWAPVPVETTTKSSASSSASDEKPVTRRFKVEPVETSSKSSRQYNAPSDDAAPPAKSKPARRFAPEPVESSHKSSKDRLNTTDAAKKPVRWVAPQPVETSHISSKDKNRGEAGKSSHVNFQPQPIETSARSSRKNPIDDEDLPAVRRFAPVLLDTAKRSRKANKPVKSQAEYKTESGHQLHAREHRRHITGAKTPRVDLNEPNEGGRSTPTHPIDLGAELRRQIAPLDGSPRARPVSMSSNRSHSFRLPDLDTIESSESDGESNLSSRSVSPGQGSPTMTSDSSFVEVYKHATRIRESVDENFAQYFLQIEAKRAQQRMQEQALAAFPNSDIHEPVQHYVNDDNSDEDMEIEDRPGTWEGHDEDIFMEMATRRESTVKISWEQLEMQRHAERLEQERNANKITKKPSESPWWNPAVTYGFKEPDSELKSMHDRARPPMLGDDIVFPRCPSPEPARFDVTQGSASLRNQMCYLTEQSQNGREKDDEDEGLWKPKAENGFVMTAAGTANHTNSDDKKGLWGGFCVDAGDRSPTSGLLSSPNPPTGLLTPAVEHSSNPFEASFSAVPPDSLFRSSARDPPTPPESLRKTDLAQIDSVLVSERELDELMIREYPDSFITQVYNYLSLGYPSLARPFDEELSKISRIPIPELRQDDKKAKQTPRGYIRLGPDFEGGGGEGITEESCVRWQALKLYVREWVRQEKDMVPLDPSGGNWATLARRGSWAI